MQKKKHFGPIFPSFGPKTSKKDISQKKSFKFKSTLRLNITVHSYKK